VYSEFAIDTLRNSFHRSLKLSFHLTFKCCSSMSVLHVNVNTACPCRCCMPRSMLDLHVHVNAARQCPFGMSMSMSVLHVHVLDAQTCQCCMFISSCYKSMQCLHAICPCCMAAFFLHIQGACLTESPFCLSMLHVHVSMLHSHASCTCLFAVYVHAACPLCLSMLHRHVH
jgi:hypothetical protein